MNPKLIYILFAGVGLFCNVSLVETKSKTQCQKKVVISSVYQQDYEIIHLKDTIAINFPLDASKVIPLPSFIEMQANKTTVISFYIKNTSKETVWIYASSNTGGLAPREFPNKLLPKQVILIEYMYAPRPGGLDKVVTLRWKTSKNLGFYENEIININLKGYRKLE